MQRLDRVDEATKADETQTGIASSSRSAIGARQASLPSASSSRQRVHAGVARIAPKRAAQKGRMILAMPSRCRTWSLKSCEVRQRCQSVAYHERGRVDAKRGPNRVECESRERWAIVSERSARRD